MYDLHETNVGFRYGLHGCGAVGLSPTNFFGGLLGLFDSGSVHVRLAHKHLITTFNIF